MSKLSVVLFYWVTIVLALLFAKYIGIADNTGALVTLLAIVTIFYLITTKIQLSKAEKAKSKSAAKSEKQYNGSSHGNKKKKGGHK